MFRGLNKKVCTEHRIFVKSLGKLSRAHIEVSFVGNLYLERLRKIDTGSVPKFGIHIFEQIWCLVCTD